MYFTRLTWTEVVGRKASEEVEKKAKDSGGIVPNLSIKKL